MNLSPAEKLAKEAESLDEFTAFKLEHVRKQVTELLGHIGRNNIFAEYTIHDISHIDEMLKALEWIIPKETKEIMSPVDWLLIVLAIYFHDMGMLVTTNEFQNRENSNFPNFKKQVFDSEDDQTKDYASKLEVLSENQLDEFLYQEFIRTLHAARIRNWLDGKNDVALGDATAVTTEINKLLDTLPKLFRNDLAIICESHHLDDLDDLKKYQPTHPYGNSQSATANVQYAAIILRSVDLLHITKDRVPSVSFRIINPQNPLSQNEWAKQRAVNRVWPRQSSADQLNRGLSGANDTISVNAHFEDEKGYFGLQSYLTYAERELSQCYKWSEKARDEKGTAHFFPWKRIERNIETEGFLNDNFQFNLDQDRILNLLTGHTLYNDGNVVVRELIQNSIDAIRLQFKASDPRIKGKILVSWNETERNLTVRDNGTGMSQLVISNHFLTVGSSFYSSNEFRRQNPDFSAISKFGIGVLSAFMIANEVEVVTVSEEDGARKLILESVHDQFLVKLLGKDDSTVKNIGDHGTEIRLRIRPSVEIKNIVSIVRKWVVLPECELKIEVNGKHVDTIAPPTLQDALSDLLIHSNTTTQDPNTKKLNLSNRLARHASTEDNTRQVKISELKGDGVSLAVALVWQPYLRQWTFLTRQGMDRKSSRLDGNRSVAITGICVEGIRVSFGSPGLEIESIIALANLSGPTAPRTNVARSSLDETVDLTKTYSKLYDLYCRLVREQQKEMMEKQGFSLSWAAKEAQFMSQALISSATSSDRRKAALLEEKVNDLPLVVIESGKNRSTISYREALELKEFVTIQSPTIDSINYFIREAHDDLSIATILETFDKEGYRPFDTPILTEVTAPSIVEKKTLLFNAIPTKVSINQLKRRIDVTWARPSDPNICTALDLHRITDSNIRRAINDQRTTTRYADAQEVWNCMFFPGPDFEDGSSGGQIVESNQCLIFGKGTAITQFMRKLLTSELPDLEVLAIFNLLTNFLNRPHMLNEEDVKAEARSARHLAGLRELGIADELKKIDFQGLLDALNQSNLDIVTKWNWSRFHVQINDG